MCLDLVNTYLFPYVYLRHLCQSLFDRSIMSRTFVQFLAGLVGITGDAPLPDNCSWCITQLQRAWDELHKTQTERAQCRNTTAHNTTNDNVQCSHFDWTDWPCRVDFIDSVIIMMLVLLMYLLFCAYQKLCHHYHRVREPRFRDKIDPTNIKYTSWLPFSQPWHTVQWLPYFHNNKWAVCCCAQEQELHHLMALRCCHDLFQNCCVIQVVKVVLKQWIEQHELVWLHVCVYCFVIFNLLSHISFLSTQMQTRAAELKEQRALLWV